MRLVLPFAALLMFAVGCVGGYVDSRDRRDNPLAGRLALTSFGGPKLSPRTEATLKRFDLLDQYPTHCDVCVEQLRKLIEQTPEGELIHALGELAYVEGKRAESDGRAADALNYYGVALTGSYDYLFATTLDDERNPYDPQFREMCDLYNQSLEDTLRLLCSKNRIRPGHTYTIDTPDRRFVVRTAMRGNWKPDEFDRYEFVSDYAIRKLRNRHTTFGLGVPLIAVRNSPGASDDREAYYPDGLSYSVTALMRCTDAATLDQTLAMPQAAASNGLIAAPTAVGSLRPETKPIVTGSTDPEADPASRRRHDNRVCVLEFFDPLVAGEVQLGRDWVPLETDLTTPLAYFLDSPDFRKRNAATEGLLNPQSSQDKAGLYMLEPYDPDRIPVLMLHGLWSSPLTWMDMFNDLRSFPEIRSRYQFWFYLYPSGQPFWISATQLRNDLAEMRRAFDPTGRDDAIDQMVLVGHSMGGLVARMQTIDSGDQFWNIVSDTPAENSDAAVASLNGKDNDRNKLVSTLFFKPNRSVSRVITIGTPHRGSEFANPMTRWLARQFIKLPEMTTRTGRRLLADNPELFKGRQLLTTANAIDSLTPDSPIFPVMMRAAKNPDVKYHNIIGVLEDPSFVQTRIGSGDGVVPYESATMPDVDSELIVDADHMTIHMIPKTIFEVRRILLEHTREIDEGDRVATDRFRRSEGSF